MRTLYYVCFLITLTVCLICVKEVNPSRYLFAAVWSFGMLVFTCAEGVIDALKPKPSDDRSF